MRRWLVLGVFVAAGACTASPPSQVPVPAITSTPVTTVTVAPSTSVPPPVTVTVTPPKPTTSPVTKSPWRCEPGYPNCTKAQSQKYLAELEYQKCLRDPEKIWDIGTQKCRYKTSGEVQWEHFYGPLPPGTP
ncbi:hypothetical protein [Amycolatopsis keratiniphila]|uniref:Uncharacterized protein n=1 Tax=Amycolatopsis keratiniphila subsp. keratiniphila TaxID=227715 RepID=A0A1W2LSL0_9PSEU|nr:hypothetical protein [Amycolatopsis keratiniphila]ONF67854.1 hypothetical protein AVR91_0220600 [Amycolatopsis keratiniphila subsp. keratiniphila]